jgi:hypothetical protein
VGLLVRVLVLAVVAIAVVAAVRAVRDASEPAATVPGALVSRAGAAAAASSLRAAAAAMEAYRVEHGTYAGAGPSALRAYDATLDPAVRVARADAAGYCLETSLGGTPSSLSGPGGAPVGGGC